MLRVCTLIIRCVMRPKGRMCMNIGVRWRGTERKNGSKILHGAGV